MNSAHLRRETRTTAKTAGGLPFVRERPKSPCARSRYTRAQRTSLSEGARARTASSWRASCQGGLDKKRSWNVSKAFGHYTKKLELGEQRQVFHALRNTFTEAMEAAEV